jgi:hypothetical protein
MSWSTLPAEVRVVAERVLTRKQLDVFRMRMNSASWSQVMIVCEISEPVARRTYNRAVQLIELELRKEPAA